MEDAVGVRCTCAKISSAQGTQEKARSENIMPKVGMVSLGCPKNLVDSEVMLGLLARQGYELTSRPDEADVIVVNTCAFIAPAKQESINTILEMAEYKKFGSRASWWWPAAWWSAIARRFSNRFRS